MMNQKPTLKKKHVINSKLGERRDQNELGFGSPSDWLLRRRKFSYTHQNARPRKRGKTFGTEPSSSLVLGSDWLQKTALKMKFPTLKNGHCISKKICLEQLSAKCRMQSTLHWGLVAQRLHKIKHYQQPQ